MVLPSGMVVPGTAYLVGLATATVFLTAVLYSMKPPMTTQMVVGLVPWMFVGGALHVFYQLGAVDPLFAPLFSAPSVYVTTFDLLAVSWITATFVGRVWSREPSIPNYVGAIGLGIAVVLFALAVWQSLGFGGPNLVWPTLGVLVSTLVAGSAYFLLSVWKTQAIARVKAAGFAVVFAHALDGVSTAIGVDVLGTGERSPIPRAIMEQAGKLPVADAIGVGWAFVAVKLAVAMAVVVLLAPTVEDDETFGSLLLALVTAVGFGPASNNLLLFLVGA